MVDRGVRVTRRAAGRARSLVGPSGDLPVVHVGTTRFSLFQPDSPSWRLTRRADWSSAEDYAAHLFADERMEPRCDIFCNLAAPLYQEMAARHDYRHMVRYSPDLPQRWKDRLQEAARANPVLWLVEVGDGTPDVKAMLTDHLRERVGRRDAMAFVFRVDDDDLLSNDFLDQVEPYVRPHHHDYAVSFSSGFAGLYEHGRYTRVAQLQLPMSSMGQGAVGTWRGRDGALSLRTISNHARTDRQRTVVLDGRRPTFLQTRHVGQDTAVGEKDPLDAESARARIVQRFERLRQVEDTNVLRERFPTVVGRLEA